jgi:hypothetical protein
VPAFVHLLDDFRREGFEVRRLAAGDKPLIGDDLFVDPLAAGVDDVGLDGFVGGAGLFPRTSVTGA